MQVMGDLRDTKMVSKLILDKQWKMEQVVIGSYHSLQESRILKISERGNLFDPTVRFKIEMPQILRQQLSDHKSPQISVGRDSRHMLGVSTQSQLPHRNMEIDNNGIKQGYPFECLCKQYPILHLNYRKFLLKKDFDRIDF